MGEDSFRNRAIKQKNKHIMCSIYLEFRFFSFRGRGWAIQFKQWIFSPALAGCQMRGCSRIFAVDMSFGEQPNIDRSDSIPWRMGSQDFFTRGYIMLYSGFHGDRKCLKDPVVGPLPNRCFMSYNKGGCRP